MANVTEQNGPPAPAAPATENRGLWSQMMMMQRVYRESPVFPFLLCTSIGSFFVVVATAIGQIVLNQWNKPFYDAIERRDVDTFFHQLLVFAGIASVLLLLNVSQRWFNQEFRLKLREGLTTDLITEWMRPRRAFRLAHAGAIGVNPDQRMQEDAGHLTELTTDLAFGLLQSSTLLFSFVGVLWSLSAGFVFDVGGHSFEIPGYMVWAAMIYAGSASCLSWLVGRPLIGLNSERYNREATLRFTMMRVNEHIDSVSLAGGEAGEQQRLVSDLDSVLGAMRGIFRAQINLGWIVDGYGWVTVVAPLLVAAPAYFAGHISFGGLMMAVGAFNQVHTSLRWFIANIGAITDWRATLQRITDFRSALVGTDALDEAEGRIEFQLNETNRLTIDGLSVNSSTGRTRLDDPHVQISPGERVLIMGDAGAGKTLFFRALAGLWPWGSGRIGLPKDEAVTFLARTPYLAPGRLRDVLSYPNTETITDAALAEALSKVGMQRIAPRLDEDARWDRELNDEETRLVAIARLLLQRPHWIVIDQLLEVLEGPSQRRVLSLLRTELADAAVVAIGRPLPDGHQFSRVIELIRDQRPPRQQQRVNPQLESTKA